MTTLIDDIVNVTITKESSAVERAGFGVPLLVSLQTVSADRVEYFSGGDILADMVTAGHLTTGSAYKQAQKVLAQNPRVSRIAIGRADAADAADWVVTMTAIAAFDNTGWYGFAVDTRLQADVEALALWAETQSHIYFALTIDAAVKAGTGGNVAEVLQGLSYRRTALQYDEAPEQYAECAAMGRMLVADLDVNNGSTDLAFKTLAGVAAISLTGAERAIIHGLACNTYELRAGKNIYFEGNMVGGTVLAPIPIFETISLDWLDTRTTEDAFAWLSSSPTKRGFNQAGIDALRGTVDARWQIAVINGHLNSATVTAPAFEELQKADVEATHLRTISASGTLQTALRKVTVVGKVSV